MIGRRTAPPPVEAGNEPSGLQSFDDFELRLGDIMRGERATLGKSLLDVQRELKIKASYIAAIENADPSAFETPGFVAGYVRSYARYLKLDPEWAYKQFCLEGGFELVHTFRPERVGKAKAKRPDGAVRGTVSRDPFENPNTPFTPRGESVMARIEPGALGSVTVLVALIGGIGYGGWSVLQQVQQVQLTPVDQPPGVVAQVDPLSPGGPDAVTDTAGLVPPPSEGYDRVYRPRALEVPVLTARDGAIATLDPSTTGTLFDAATEEKAITVTQATPAPAAAPVPAPAVKVVEDAPQQVVMFALRPSWVRVRSADGTVLFEKILDAGETYVLPQTEEPPTLRAGNAGSVYFQVAGETYGPAGAGGAVVKNIALGPDDLRGAYNVADLTQNRELASVVASLGPLTPAD